MFYVSANEGNQGQFGNAVLLIIIIFGALLRICVVTYKIVIVIMLMFSSLTVDLLLVNSIAFIFILDMDT